MNVWDTFSIGKTMDQTRGPGSEKGSMDPWFMFCPYPAQNAGESWSALGS